MPNPTPTPAPADGAPIRVTTVPASHESAASRSDLARSEERAVVDLPMTAADRRRVRRRLQAPDGTEFLLELPTGSVLPVGAALHTDDDTVYRITAAPEDVVVVRPRTVREAAFVGHLIGNLHRDVDLAGDEIVALWDAPLEARLRAAELDVVRAERPFSGRAPGEHSH